MEKDNNTVGPYSWETFWYFVQYSIVGPQLLPRQRYSTTERHPKIQFLKNTFKTNSVTWYFFPISKPNLIVLLKKYSMREIYLAEFMEM